MKLENMFFEYKYVDATGSAFEISSKSTVNSETEKYAKKYAKKVIADCRATGKTVSVNLYLSVPENAMQRGIP